MTQFAFCEYYLLNFIFYILVLQCGSYSIRRERERKREREGENKYLLHHTISLRLSRVSRFRECIKWCKSPPGALSRLKSLSAVEVITSLLLAASFMLDKVLLSHGQLFRAACSSEAVACN